MDTIYCVLVYALLLLYTMQFNLFNWNPPNPVPSIESRRLTQLLTFRGWPCAKPQSLSLPVRGRS